jgi:hypothetical protein
VCHGTKIATCARPVGRELTSAPASLSLSLSEYGKTGSKDLSWWLPHPGAALCVLGRLMLLLLCVSPLHWRISTFLSDKISWQFLVSESGKRVFRQSTLAL